MVDKLGLTTRPHPHPCYIQWLNSYDRIQVTEIAHIEFSIGFYKGSLDFDIVPLQVCQLLLGKPWISENNVVHNTIANKYSFKYHGRKITLIPMNAAKILEADLERMREERVNRLGENGLFRMFQHFHLNLVLYKMKILLCLLLELIFCSMYQKKRTR